MNILWAPWRIKYILGKKEKNCIFCIHNREGTDEENLILYRGKLTTVIMNKYPYNNGHLLVAPIRHVPELDDLTIEELADLMIKIRASVDFLRKEMQPDGFNVGLNIGKVAGAGVAAHLHFHIVPRWNGDTSFMTTLGETRVIPESLKETYKRLKPYFDKLREEE
ncbi:MAG TPA: HIT domain-containing protein [Candidatus Desulfofervidus auxilii]|uniref:HIT domain-containing protein n=1 Tax=Desulfofervidus auxilii TaxID=1621989 RepID=A0A7C0Y3J9_DESA2|nr:HIT domain-containing protein [Candidatus Desulfofervidus auxilii]HDD44806.1 HIT domain-containing protein [Candidatus Desulfofervidus auxilii]